MSVVLFQRRFGGGRQAGQPGDQGAVGEHRHPFFRLQPGARILDRFGVVQLDRGDRRVHIHVAEPMPRLFRQESFVKGAQSRVSMDREERVLMVVPGAGQFVRERVCALDDSRRRRLFGRAQEPDPLHAETQPQLAARPRERNGENEPRDRGRHPQHERWGDQGRREQGDQAEQRVRAVPARNAAEWYRPVVAALRMPAGVPSGKNLRHRARLDEHHDRRKRRGNEDLDQRRGDEREGAS